MGEFVCDQWGKRMEIVIFYTEGGPHTTCSCLPRKFPSNTELNILARGVAVLYILTTCRNFVVDRWEHVARPRQSSSSEQLRTFLIVILISCCQMIQKFRLHSAWVSSGIHVALESSVCVSVADCHDLEGHLQHRPTSRGIRVGCP